MNSKKSCFMFVITAMTLFVWALGPAVAAEKPNILVIWGDDVGVHNISA